MNSMLSIAVNVAVSYNPSKLMHQQCLLSISISSAIRDKCHTGKPC
jgi:hypothetical protein